VIACDGLIPRLAPETAGIVYPVRGQIAATEALPPERRVIECPTHSMFGFMYYRPSPDGRITVGGGRLADLEAEYTEEEATTPAVQGALDRFAADVLGLEGVRMTHRWAGIMGFSCDLLPLAGELRERRGVYVCGGYSGVGNVQGHHCGTLVADLIAVGHHPDAEVYDPNRFGPGARPPAVEKERSRALLAVMGSRSRP
jgi:glycine/D-amino acid oxidase-like deaminating enzyme